MSEPSQTYAILTRRALRGRHDCTQFMILPPSLGELLGEQRRTAPATVPGIVPAMIDRDMPRCWRCDLRQAEDREASARALLQVEDMRPLRAIGMWREADRVEQFAIFHLRAAIYLAWVPFWAIWGRLRDQEWMTMPRFPPDMPGT